MDSGTKRLVSISESRKLLGDIGHTTLYDLVKRGELTKVNIGRRGMITSESLTAYMDRLARAASAGVQESGDSAEAGQPDDDCAAALA
jgi:hypothetical protein